MTRFLGRLVFLLAGIAVAAVLVDRAASYEQARASGTLSERDELPSSSQDGTGSRPGLTPRSESVLPTRYQGKGVRWWAKRAVQARRDANARGRTIRRLQRVVGQKFIPPYWVAVASCESGVSWGYNGSSGFDGALQFHPGTWSAYRLPGYPSRAYRASPFQQLVIGELVLAAQGWRAWPACSRKLGLR